MEKKINEIKKQKSAVDLVLVEEDKFGEEDQLVIDWQQLDKMNKTVIHKSSKSKMMFQAYS